jgi:hypothetical protein
MHLRSPRSTPLGRIAVVAATLWWGCADTGGVGPRPPRMASFALSRGPDVVMQQASGRPTVVTHVRIRLRDDTLLVADTVAAFPRTAASLTVQVVVGLAARTRSLRATVEYLGASEVLLQTAGVVTARSADEPAVGDTLPPPVLPPGTPVPDVIEVFPRDTILFQGDSMLPRVTAIRGGATLSTVTYVQVSAASDVLVEPASGWVHVPARRGAAWVRVRIPGTTLRDSVLVRFQPRPSGLVIASGGNQSATAGTTLAQPLVARVVASDGQPVAGVAVSFAAPVAPGAAVATPVAISDSTGLVRTEATVSTVAAAQAFTATAAGVAPLAFPAMSLPGAPAQIIADAGATTTATASSPVAVRPMVRVRDTHGNSVPDASIVFRRANVARGTIADSALATDAQGLAMLGTWVAGPEVGEDTVLAAVVSPSLGPVRFVATVAPGAVASIVKAGGDAQDGLPDTVLPESLVVQVRDAFGNGVPGQSVTFSASGGTLTRTVATTNANGLASAGLWTLPSGFGSRTVTATVAGASPVAFTATTAAGVPTSVQLSNVGAPSDTIEAQRVGIVGTLRDGMNQPLAGRTLRLRPRSPQSGSIVAGDSVGTTSAAGTVTFAGRWQLAAAPGADTLDLVVDGVPSLRDSAVVMVGPGRPASLTRTAGDGQSGPAATALPTAPQVQVTDRGGNALAGETVTFSAAGGGTVTVTSATTDTTGRASAGSWTLGASGTQTVTASVAGVPGATFTATIAPTVPPPFTWGDVSIIGEFYGVDCAGPTFCVAVADGGIIRRWNGTAWLSMTSGTTTNLRNVACVSATDCVVVGEGGLIRRWNGSTWVAQSSGTTQHLRDVTCVTASDCVAVGDGGTIRRWNGSSWTGQSSGTSVQMFDVACASSAFCVAVGNSGVIRQWNGTAWVGHASGTPLDLMDVTCVVSNDCLVVGDAGTILRWNGTAWNAQASGVSALLHDVACAAPEDCWAVGTNGTIVRWNGAAWTAQPSGVSRRLRALALASSGLAYAVGETGTILRGAR